MDGPFGKHKYPNGDQSICILNSFEIFVDAELYRDETEDSLFQNKTRHTPFRLCRTSYNESICLKLGNLKYYRHIQLSEILVTSNEQAHSYRITCD